MRQTGEAPPRLVLISKHFPPSDEVGSLRWQKLAALAPANGFELDAVTISMRELRRQDERRSLDLPSGTRVVRVSSAPTVFDAFERLVATRKLLWKPEATVPARRNAPPPFDRPISIGKLEARAPWESLASLRRAYHATAEREAELSWARRAAGAAYSELGRPKPAAVVSCGPPHQVHLAARKLACRWQVPFVMDMRDPWGLVERVPEAQGSKWLWTLAGRDEERCVQDAALVVVNTEAHRRALIHRYPTASERIVAVLNGYDTDPLPSSPQNPAFTILYAGTIYLDRNPQILFEAVAKVVQKRGFDAGQLRLVFLGDVQGEGGISLESLAASAGISSHLDVIGRLPRLEAMNILAAADMTVILHQDSRLAVPSKVYEYLRFPSAVLALADANSAVAEVLAGSGADVIAPTDVNAVAAAIESRMDARDRHGRPAPLATLLPDLSRTAQAAKIFGYLRRIVASASERVATSAILTSVVDSGGQ